METENMNRKIATLWIQGQHSVGSGNGRFGGPDTYVAVTVAPEGVELPKILRDDVLEKRGIKVKYFGSGYRAHTGPNSKLGMAIKEAQEYVDKINKEVE